LARLEGVIALTTLHARFPTMRLAIPPAALHWSHGDGLVLRGLTELPVILDPRRDHPLKHRTADETPTAPLPDLSPDPPQI
jgi:hypothetical protein